MLLEPAVGLVALRDLVAAVEDPCRREDLPIFGAVRIADVDPVVGVEAGPWELHHAVGRGGLPSAGRRDIEDALAVLRHDRAMDRMDPVLDRELAADRA